MATLPGVVRPGGFFGPLVIRGAGDKANRYFIDDIPVPNPQHFGGLQSIISNDLMREIDLYASAFPSQFGGALGAIIDIQTIDEVKELGGVIDVSLISANYLVKNTWGKNYGGETTVTSAEKGDNTTEETSAKNSSAKGYWISSGRIGYLSLFVPPIYKLITGKSLDRLPQYYDYQLKGKVFLDTKGRHALSLLAFGSYDTLKFVRNLSEEEKAKRKAEGDDPFLAGFNLSNDITSHSQGLYYDYIPSAQISNRLILFNSFTYSYFYANFTDTRTIGPIDLKIYPSILGIKDKTKWEWASFATLRTALEYNLYYFKSMGQTQQQLNVSAGGPPDYGNLAGFASVPVDFSTTNHLVSSYIENKFQFGGWNFVPGVRGEFLSRNRSAIIDPRALIGYTFDSDTTVSAAGGQYQSFSQTNTFYFNQVFNYQPQVVVADYIKPERAFHRTLGIEQKIVNYTLKIEGFLNDFDRLLEAANNGQVTGKYFSNNGALKARGVEVIIRKDSEEKEFDYYGWVSYTYTQGERLRYGAWGKYEFEQPHSLKLVGGIKWRAHTLGAQFQLFSGYPYTNITGSTCTTGFDCSSPSTARYSPLYSSNSYDGHFTASHRLDIRYTHKTAYKWGYFSWYIEVINIYNQQAANQLKWNYNEPYSSSNPKIQIPDGIITIIPYFGLEWRF
ncbi:MAG TPA: TonB-dependent receptor plug domain-containing protein [Turneriella sp.]|nr:TonB-dependent receptor plug domain-containing protein [Turneriella sp.]